MTRNQASGLMNLFTATCCFMLFCTMLLAEVAMETTLFVPLVLFMGLTLGFSLSGYLKLMNVSVSDIVASYMGFFPFPDEEE